jgi:predicted amidohydrolase
MSSTPGTGFLDTSPRIDCLASELWEFVSPNPALMPLFRRGPAFRRSPALIAQGNGRAECYGYARCPVSLRSGRSYRLSVRLSAQGIEAPQHHAVQGLYALSYSGGLSILHPDGREFVGSDRFPGPAEDIRADLRLYFRYSASGRITWNEVLLEECEPIPPRLVRFACRQGATPQGASLDFWERWLDLAGGHGPDLTLLPEMFDGLSPAAANPPFGPAARMLAAKARQWSMYTSGAFYETRGDLVFNVAPLYDRHGKLVGSYDKFLPYEQELDQGVSPGRSLKVFDVDFGRVSILTCFDSWFPETARLVARQGAEVLLLPNAGYFLDLMPARAADNGLCIVASSLYHEAGVWGTSGSRAGDSRGTSSRESPSAITSVHYDYANGLLVATIDLSLKYSPHWKGGPMVSAPAARSSRVTSLRPFSFESS